VVLPQSLRLVSRAVVFFGGIRRTSVTLNHFARWHATICGAPAPPKPTADPLHALIARLVGGSIIEDGNERKLLAISNSWQLLQVHSFVSAAADVIEPLTATTHALQ
jgi:hypothetical protein